MAFALDDWIKYRESIKACEDSFTEGRRNNDIVNYCLATLALMKLEQDSNYIKWPAYKKECDELVLYQRRMRDYDWQEKVGQVYDHYFDFSVSQLKRLLIDIEY